jgi:hypothetical protein
LEAGKKGGFQGCSVGDDILDELIAMAEQIDCEQSEKSRKWWDEHRQEMRHPELSMQCPHCRMLERLRQLRAEQGSAERA